MSRSDRSPESEPDTATVSDDIQDSLGFYGEVLGNDDRIDELVDSGGDPDAELFVDNNDTSLTEQARNDAELLTSGRMNGARAYIRDFVPALAMWGLFVGTVVVVSELVIDYLGPAAGPLWEVRRTIGHFGWVAVTRGSELLLVALRSDYLLLAGLAIAGYLVFVKRRW